MGRGERSGTWQSGQSTKYVVHPARTLTLTLSEPEALEGFEQSCDTICCVFQWDILAVG